MFPILTRSFAGLILIATALAGCAHEAEPPREQAYGAYYAARVAGVTGACTVDLPWPHQGSVAWDAAKTPSPGATATLVTTEHGPALRLSGTGTTSLNTSARASTPFSHALSMREAAYVANGTLQEGTHWVRVEGCTGGRVDLLWLHDDEPDGAEETIEGPAVAGWRAMKTVKERVP